MKNTAIFGIGPSGLAAAWACLRRGDNVTLIADRYDPSTLYGCQYLHEAIPGYEDVPTATVSYDLIGTPEQYRRKVYGYSWAGKVSPEDFIGNHQAWDIRETYRRLWNDIIPEVEFIQAKVSPEWILYTNDLDKYSEIISTIPAPALCFRRSQHIFSSHTIYAIGGTALEWRQPDLHSIICDGTSDHEWYRSAQVFGYRTTEWATVPPYFSGGASVKKPLSADCDCFSRIRRLGRYGAWAKGILVHNVFNDIEKAS